MMCMIYIMVWFLIGYFFGVLGFVVIDEDDVTVSILVNSILFSVGGPFIMVAFFVIWRRSIIEQCKNYDRVLISRETIINFFKGKK